MATGMAAITDQERQKNESRQHRKARCQYARSVAKARAVEAYNALIAAADPREWRTAEEMDAYTEVLVGQRGRVGGIRPAFVRTLKPKEPAPTGFDPHRF